MDACISHIIYGFFCFRIFKIISKHGKAIIRQMKMANKIFLDNSVHYLDLALETCQCNCLKNMKLEMIKNLSTTCAEYLLAESEAPQNGSFETMFVKLNSCLQILFLDIESDRNDFIQECYKKFTSIFFLRFQGLDRTQKRAKCRSLLRIHRILQIMDFHDNGLKNLILAATCSEPDPEMTVEILSAICRTEFMMLQCMLILPDGALKAMLSNAKRMGFDFWGLWRGVGHMSTKCNLIAGLMSEESKLHAIILLQHGFPYLYSYSIYKSQCIRFFYASLRARVYFADDGYNQLLSKPNKARMMLIITTFVTVCKLMAEATLRDENLATLRCLMRSIPDPYVLPSEMYNELTPFFMPAFTEQIESVCTKYQEYDIFSEDYAVYKPRKLKHLCRCVIRRVLSVYWRLPEGIYQLGMPPKIIKHLSLDS